MVVREAARICISVHACMRCKESAVLHDKSQEWWCPWSDESCFRGRYESKPTWVVYEAFSRSGILRIMIQDKLVASLLVFVTI